MKTQKYYTIFPLPEVILVSAKSQDQRFEVKEEQIKQFI